MKYFKKLVGDRIYLSPRNSEDVEKFTEWMNDFEITDYIGRSGSIMSISGEKRYLENDDNPQGVFSIITLDENKLIGSIGLKGVDDININRKATLGIFIGDKEYQNNGYGTEAIKLILEYGFKYLNLHSVKLHVFSFNKRAKRCYEKCGFKEVGKSRENVFINGKWYDTIIMDILENEFEGEYIRNKNI